MDLPKWRELGELNSLDIPIQDCLDSRRSTSGYMFFLWNGLISWSSKRQQCVSTSSAEAEYVGECNTAKELTFLVQALKEVGYDGSDTNPTTILADNEAESNEEGGVQSGDSGDNQQWHFVTIGLVGAVHDEYLAVACQHITAA